MAYYNKCLKTSFRSERTILTKLLIFLVLVVNVTVKLGAGVWLGTARFTFVRASKYFTYYLIRNSQRYGLNSHSSFI